MWSRPVAPGIAVWLPARQLHYTLAHGFAMEVSEPTPTANPPPVSVEERAPSAAGESHSNNTNTNNGASMTAPPSSGDTHTAETAPAAQEPDQQSYSLPVPATSGELAAGSAAEDATGGDAAPAAGGATATAGAAPAGAGAATPAKKEGEGGSQPQPRSAKRSRDAPLPVSWFDLKRWEGRFRYIVPTLYLDCIHPDA